MSIAVKLGFIGCGGHAVRHVEALAQIPGEFEVVAVYDANPQQSKHFSEMFPAHNIEVALSINEFMAIPMDAVFIGTPHVYHLGYSQMAIAQGRHVFCEKPLWEGDFHREGATLMKRAAEKGLVFTSCHPRRFDEEYASLKTALPGLIAELGPVVEFAFRFFYHEPSTSWKHDDSLLLDHMNHEIDLAHFLLGDSPAEFHRLAQGFDEYQVIGKSTTGVLFRFSGYRRLKSRTYRNELEIAFERGRVSVASVLESSTGIVAIQYREESFDKAVATSKQFRAEYNHSLASIMQNFARSIRGEEANYLTPSEMLLNNKLCNDLHVSTVARTD